MSVTGYNFDIDVYWWTFGYTLLSNHQFWGLIW